MVGQTCGRGLSCPSFTHNSVHFEIRSFEHCASPSDPQEVPSGAKDLLEYLTYHFRGHLLLLLCPLPTSFEYIEIQCIANSYFPDLNYALSTFDSPCRFSGQKPNFEARNRENGASQSKRGLLEVI